MSTIPASQPREWVWEYPRPPLVLPVDKRIRVVLGGFTIVDTHNAVRVLETTHPPVYYVPLGDVSDWCLFARFDRVSVCEFKGKAIYYDVYGGDRLALRGAWSYLKPVPGYELLRKRVAFYPSSMDACYVDDELVTPQQGDLYGGWITSQVVGPFKGAEGTLGW